MSKFKYNTDLDHSNLFGFIVPASFLKAKKSEKYFAFLSKQEVLHISMTRETCLRAFKEIKHDLGRTDLYAFSFYRKFDCFYRLKQKSETSDHLKTAYAAVETALSVKEFLPLYDDTSPLTFEESEYFSPSIIEKIEGANDFMVCYQNYTENGLSWRCEHRELGSIFISIQTDDLDFIESICLT